MRGVYDDLSREGRRHATVEVAFARVHEMVREAGIPGLQATSDTDPNFFEWRQGWQASHYFEVKLRVSIDPDAELALRGLVRFQTRVQWPSHGETLAVRSAILLLAGQVNALSARIEMELDGEFIIDEKRYDEHGGVG